MITQTITIAEAYGCKLVKPTWTDFNEKWLKSACKYIVDHARPMDIEEWSRFDINEGRDLSDILYWAVKGCCGKVCAVIDEVGNPTAFVGISGGQFLWSFWSEPSPSAVKACVKHIGDCIDAIHVREPRRDTRHSFSGTASRGLTNYIHEDNTFFIRLLEKQGAVFNPAPEYSANYLRFDL